MDDLLCRWGWGGREVSVLTPEICCLQVKVTDQSITLVQMWGSTAQKLGTQNVVAARPKFTSGSRFLRWPWTSYMASLWSRFSPKAVLYKVVVCIKSQWVAECPYGSNWSINSISYNYARELRSDSWKIDLVSFSAVLWTCWLLWVLGSQDSRSPCLITWFTFILSWRPSRGSWPSPSPTPTSEGFWVDLPLPGPSPSSTHTIALSEKGSSEPWLFTSRKVMFGGFTSLAMENSWKPSTVTVSLVSVFSMLWRLGLWSWRDCLPRALPPTTLGPANS